MKIAPLALNIPTFINLYGYGYENIYELDSAVDLRDDRIEITGNLDLFKLKPMFGAEQIKALKAEVKK